MIQAIKIISASDGTIHVKVSSQGAIDDSPLSILDSNGDEVSQSVSTASISHERDEPIHAREILDNVVLAADGSVESLDIPDVTLTDV